MSTAEDAEDAGLSTRMIDSLLLAESETLSSAAVAADDWAVTVAVEASRV